MKVTLLTCTPLPEKTIAAAAKLCYSSADVETLTEGLTPEKTSSFVSMLAEIGHESPIEHASFTFGIEGISRSCTHQLVRHRIASYSQKSQRYVSEGGFEYVTPPEIAEDEASRRLFEQTMEDIDKAYNRLAQTLTEKHEKTFLAEGQDEKTAHKNAVKKAIEDARFVLPNACETKIIVTMNARSLMNFFTHRCCNRAQWEIRAVADEMLRLCKEQAPDLFKLAGPPCLRGACPEGKMSCGKAAAMRKRYQAE